MPTQEKISDKFPNSIGLTINNAQLSWHDRVLFDGLYLELPPASITCLLGPSGVGKSMLLRLILGLDGDNNNYKMISSTDGEPITGRVAFMAQQDLLFPWLKVIDNVLIGQKLRNETDFRDKALKLLELAGLSGVAEQMPNTLSGGMRQRVAIARTLLEDRPIVLMDEPFSSLDAITKVKIQTLAANLLQGRTVLLVTHDPLEALRLGHTIFVMRGNPAMLGAPIQPSSPPPRNINEKSVLKYQGELLKQLAEATQ